MTVKFRNYTEKPGITEDYFQVRAFLVELGYSEYPFARWDWMITHTYLDVAALPRIGLWEDQGKLVGLAAFDCYLGPTFCLTAPAYGSLKKEVIQYARSNLFTDDDSGILIRDTEEEYQEVVAGLGFVASEDTESDAVFYPEKTPMVYSLPPGYRLTTLQEDYDLYKYGRVLWRGFNHELKGEGPFNFTGEKERALAAEMIRPNVDLGLKIAVVSPEGYFVSYCGMWYDPEAGFAVVEPVATDPDYRGRGLGKAVVLEGIRRVAGLGAKRVFVGSSQQFYYNIGFYPFSTATRWRMARGTAE